MCGIVSQSRRFEACHIDLLAKGWLFVIGYILKLMNMKTRLLGMMAILVSIFAMTACQKDNDTWKQLPVGQISVESGKSHNLGQ